MLSDNTSQSLIASIRSNLPLKAYPLFTGQETITVTEHFKLSHKGSHVTVCADNGIIYHKRLLDGTTTNATTPSMVEIELKSLSDQSKVMCLTDTGIVQRVEYILADYEPITFLQPSRNNTKLPYQNRYSMPCAVVGYPRPQLSWLNIDDALNTQTVIDSQWPFEVVEGPSSLTLRIEEYLGFFYHGRYACRASNVWESSLQVMHLPTMVRPTTPPPG